MEDAFRDVPAGTLLIETMLWRPGQGVALARRHRDRMCLSARKLGFAFDPAGFAAKLSEVTGNVPQRVRLTLDRAGGFDITCAPAPAPATRWRVAIAPEVLASNDPWLGVKSTRRALYDRVRAALPDGIDEALFVNEKGRLCEGTITNVLVQRNGRWITPPLSDGVLPGVMRAEVLGQGGARVGSITRDALESAPRLRLCNALRGLIKAELVPWP